MRASVQGDHTTGKTPIFGAYQLRKTPFPEREIAPKLKQGCNLGFVCGEASDITVLDIDWYNPAIMDYLFDGLDVSKWCTQKHGTGGKGHIIFKYAPALNSLNGTHQVLGFDILSQNSQGRSSNCVCAPSVHYSGEIYKLNMDIKNRVEMPEILVQRITYVIKLYAEIKNILLNCKAAFRNFWEALFSDIHSDIYHKANIVFRGDMENRIRSLGLFTELKANKATTEHLLLCCRLVFAEDFKETHCMKELSNLNPAYTWSAARIQKDEYLSRYYTGVTFDPFTAPLEKLEAKLGPEPMSAYTTLISKTPKDSLELVRRAFMIGAFTKHGYVNKEEPVEEVIPVKESVKKDIETKVVYKHGERVVVPLNLPEPHKATAEELDELFN